MADTRGNLQDEFLNQIRKEKLPVSIHVINGYQFNHLKVISFDNYVILVEDLSLIHISEPTRPY